MTLISIVIPCRNEEDYIENCLISVLAMKLPAGTSIEVFVMDGMSEDRTAELLQRIVAKDNRIRVLPNPGRVQSCAMNLALRETKGDWIMRLDAHSFYPTNYLELCLETALRSRADNVGGLFITMPGADTYEASLVQALSTHRFGVGNSGFRVGEGEGSADTVPYGFFRRELFGRIGLFDERLVRAQDYEFNRRIIAAGGKVWRNPEIQVRYHNQPTLWAFFRKQILREAPYNAYLWYVAPYAFAFRHAITGAFAAGVIGGCLLSPFTSWIRLPFVSVMALYAALALFASIQQAVRYRAPFHAITLPFCFFPFHFTHGLGLLAGLLRLGLGTAPVQKRREPWKGAGQFYAWPLRQNQ